MLPGLPERNPGLELANAFSVTEFPHSLVYRVVHEAMGGTAAKFSVSALMFDYVLTGPISAV